MKRLSLIALLISAMSLSAFARGKQPIVFEKIPEMVKAAVLKNYTEQQLQFITWEKLAGKDKYEIVLTDGTKMEYYENGLLHHIHSQQGVMDVFVPEPILKYVQTTFPNATITGYTCESWSQNATLNDSMVLVFSRRGDFLRID